MTTTEININPEDVLKQLYESNAIGGLGKIYTPVEIRDKMIAKSNVKPDDVIFIMYNVEFVFDLVTKYNHDKNLIVFGSDDEVRNKIVEDLFGVECVLFKDVVKEIKNVKRMFDLIIGNPPYNKNLDLKILMEIYDLGNRICLVHPAKWLYEQKGVGLANKVKEYVNPGFVDADIFDGNSLFGIILSSDVAITYFDKSSPVHGNIDDFDIHGDSEIYKSIKRKILDYCAKQQSLRYNFYTTTDVSKVVPKGKSEVGVFETQGNKGAAFYAFIQKTNDSECVATYPNTTKYRLKFVFDTEQEAINFKDYLKTKFARFCLSIYKVNMDILYNSGSAPYCPTYTHPWSNEDCAKECGITPEELAWMMDWVPNYYDEDFVK